MDVLTDAEMDQLISRSALVRKYNEVINRESAYEILTKKIEEAGEAEHQEVIKNQRKAAKPETARSTKREKSTFEEIIDSPTTRQIGNTIARELTRGILGVLGIGGVSRRRRRT